MFCSVRRESIPRRKAWFQHQDLSMARAARPREQPACNPYCIVRCLCFLRTTNSAGFLTAPLRNFAVLQSLRIYSSVARGCLLFFPKIDYGRSKDIRFAPLRALVMHEKHQNRQCLSLVPAFPLVKRESRGQYSTYILYGSSRSEKQLCFFPVSQRPENLRFRMTLQWQRLP
jgi:hypothetical protein